MAWSQEQVGNGRRGGCAGPIRVVSISISISWADVVDRVMDEHSSEEVDSVSEIEETNHDEDESDSWVCSEDKTVHWFRGSNGTFWRRHPDF